MIVKKPKSPIINGISIHVNLDTLISSIYLAPTCPLWMRDLVSSILKKYNIKKTVRQSILNGKPVY